MKNASSIRRRYSATVNRRTDNGSLWYRGFEAVATDMFAKSSCSAAGMRSNSIERDLGYTGQLARLTAFSSFLKIPSGSPTPTAVIASARCCVSATA